MSQVAEPLVVEREFVREFPSFMPTREELEEQELLDSTDDEKVIHIYEYAVTRLFGTLKRISDRPLCGAEPSTDDGLLHDWNGVSPFCLGCGRRICSYCLLLKEAHDGRPRT